jgi:hypothetical protein
MGKLQDRFAAKATPPRVTSPSYIGGEFSSWSFNQALLNIQAINTQSTADYP